MGPQKTLHFPTVLTLQLRFFVLLLANFLFFFVQFNLLQIVGKKFSIQFTYGAYPCNVVPAAAALAAAAAFAAAAIEAAVGCAGGAVERRAA